MRGQAYLDSRMKLDAARGTNVVSYVLSGNSALFVYQHHVRVESTRGNKLSVTKCAAMVQLGARHVNFGPNGRPEDTSTFCDVDTTLLPFTACVRINLWITLCPSVRQTR